jgi:Kef-type K+ transport system membrane component KefB
VSTAEINVRILLALAVLIAGSRIAGWAISKVGQPRVLGEILAGILLGPSLLGVVWPQALEYLFPAEVVEALRVLAQVGLVLFMFLIGLELDLTTLRGNRRRALVITPASIVVPMVLGALLAAWLYPRLGGDADRLAFTLFIGAAMAITAFPVLARVLQETGLYRTRIGVLTITCAAIGDVTAWCVLAIVVAVVDATGFAETVRTVAMALLFLGTMLLVVRPALARLARLPLWLTICLAMSSAWATEMIGIHAIFGAFMAGAAMPHVPEVQRKVRRRLEPAVVSFLLPVVFVVVGLATRVDLLDDPYLWGVTVLFIGTAIAGKWGGSMIAARLVGETWPDAAAIGILMNTRGLTELVILTVGLELGVISTALYTIGVLMALVTTLMATPLLTRISPHHRLGRTAGEGRARGWSAREASADGDGSIVPGTAEGEREPRTGGRSPRRGGAGG